MPQKRNTPFYEKNRLFAVWIPESLMHFFIDYLQQNCQGDTTATQFKVFLFELHALEQRGITLVNPLKQYESDRREQLTKTFGTSDPEKLCVRQRDRNRPEDELTLMCDYCKLQCKNEYKACQELKAELQTQKTR